MVRVQACCFAAITRPEKARNPPPCHIGGRKDRTAIRASPGSEEGNALRMPDVARPSRSATLCCRAMFEDWKKAWREAVENFRRELEGADGDVSAHVRAMRHETTSARGALAKLKDEIQRTRRQAENERELEQVCRRREGLARNVNDGETVRIAREYAERHAERGAVLERKIEVLEQEHALLARDLESMEQILATQSDAAIGNTRGAQALDEHDRTDRDFGQLEQEAREKAAAQQLEELKRKMRR